LAAHERAQYWIGSVADGQWAGFISCHVVLDQAEIINLAVLPGSRRLGLGGHLLRNLMDSLARQKIRQVFLEVRQSNAAARHLYERTGFSIIGIRKHYYRDIGENAIIMSQNIGHNDK
jgi:[ribosomal protein S18]-alanine N-acetyltransferase